MEGKLAGIWLIDGGIGGDDDDADHGDRWIWCYLG